MSKLPVAAVAAVAAAAALVFAYQARGTGAEVGRAHQAPDPNQLLHLTCQSGGPKCLAFGVSTYITPSPKAAKVVLTDMVWSMRDAPPGKAVFVRLLIGSRVVLRDVGVASPDGIASGRVHLTHGMSNRFSLKQEQLAAEVASSAVGGATKSSTFLADVYGYQRSV